MAGTSTDAFVAGGVGAARRRLARLGFRANVAGASVYAGLVIRESATYPLFVPHAVGHVWAMGGILILAIWSAHCLLLAWPFRGTLGALDRRLMTVPPLLCLLAIVVCRWHYIVEWWFAPIHHH